MAIIYKIDHQLGFVEVDSELGVLRAHTDPEELKDLHVGDKILVEVIGKEAFHQRSS